jgi:hypothetical protein
VTKTRRSSVPFRVWCKLVEELATISIAEFDAESRFRALAARGSTEKGLAILDKLDASFTGQ